MKIVIVGGGPAGFSASVIARNLGAEVVVLERMNKLSGLGLQAGMHEIGASDVALTETMALGGGELFKIFDSLVIGKGIVIPGFGKISTYNIYKLDAYMQRALKEKGIEVLLRQRVVDMDVENGRAKSVLTKDGKVINGDVFIDCTGGGKGLGDCRKWGVGCVGCSLQCQVFGPLGGVVDRKVDVVPFQNEYGLKEGIFGKLGTSVIMAMDSLSENIQRELEEKGWVQVPVPESVRPNYGRAEKTGHLKGLHSNETLKHNITLLNVGGAAKITTVASPLYVENLRDIPGFEEVLLLDPVDGERGHSVRLTAFPSWENTMRLSSLKNVLCAGNKAGSLNSLLDAMVTGELAGYNATKIASGQECLEIPETLAIGSFIKYFGEMMRSENGRKSGYSVNRMDLLKKLGVYRENKDDIVKEVKRTGLDGIYKG